MNNPLRGSLVALAGLLLAGLILWFAVLVPQQREMARNLGYLQGTMLVQPLNQAIASLQGEVRSIARSPALQAAAQGPERQLSGLPALEGLIGARLVSPRSSTVDDNGVPLPEGVLDMVRRAGRGLAPELEAYETARGNLVYSVTPIQAQAGGPAEAVLVVAFTVQRLTDALHLVAPDEGRLTLVQQVFNDPQRELLTQGTSDAASLPPIPTSNSVWQLYFQPGELTQHAPLVGFGPWAWLAIAVGLAGVFAGFWLPWRRSERATQATKTAA